MDEWEQDGLRSADFGMRNQLDHILDTYSEQKARIADVEQALAAARSTATSADCYVEVTVDSSGVVVEVHFADESACRTPEQLGRAVTEAAQEAARRAALQTREIVAPLRAAADAMPDFPDLVPGAPSLREPFESRQD